MASDHKQRPQRNRQHDPDDPRLGYEIRFLDLTSRGSRACKQLGVRTVGDFLGRDRREFLRLRNCGDKTYEDIAQRVGDFLSSRGPATDSAAGDGLDRPLAGIIDNPRATRAFQSLGITTVREFFDAPREQLLGVRGFGERTYWLVTQRLRQLARPETVNLDLLPDLLLDHSLQELTLRRGVARKLARLGTGTIAELLRTASSDLHAALGEAGVANLRAALEQLLRSGIDREPMLAGDLDVDFAGSLPGVIGQLPSEERELLEHRTGIVGRALSLPATARRMGIDLARARRIQRSARRAVHVKAPQFISRLHDEAEREILTHGGFLHVDKLTRGTFLHGAAQLTDDRLVALRILRFLFAGEYFLYDDLLTTLPPDQFRALRRELRHSCARHQLPMPLPQLQDRTQHIVDPPPAGLLLHMAQTRWHLRVRIDPTLGEVLQRDGQSIGDQLADILSECRRPRTLEDILFIYRDLHRFGNMQVLLDHLRRDPRFVEVGRATWNLRSEHEDEMSLIRPIADEVIQEMIHHRERRNLLDPEANADIPERRIYLLIACMREDSRVRYLGRGLFCVPGEKSTVMEDIRTSMRRAMGEIVMSLFVDNQPRSRRRLAECLLRENRALVATAPDRIDMLSNYPFNAERLERLFTMVTEQLEAGRGYATSTELLEPICATDLGGTWLSEHMLLDLLRRHTDFELLPGGIIALPQLGLAGWIQQRIRECLRQIGAPMTKAQVLGETPDIAAFEDCIEELIASDPMITTANGTHHVLV